MQSVVCGGCGVPVRFDSIVHLFWEGVRVQSSKWYYLTFSNDLQMYQPLLSGSTTVYDVIKRGADTNSMAVENI